MQFKKIYLPSNYKIIRIMSFSNLNQSQKDSLKENQIIPSQYPEARLFVPQPHHLHIQHPFS